MSKRIAFSKRTVLRSTSGLVVAAALALPVAALASSRSTPHASHSAAAASASGGVYNLPLIAPQGTIDPLTTADANAMFIVGLASAQLVNENVKGAIIPQLADSWKAASNGLSWTFHLRSDAKFSNGAAVTPADVVWTFDQILAPKSESPAASSFTTPGNVILKSVKAGAGNTVVFKLAKKYSDFPYLLTGANTWILPEGTSVTSWIKNPVGAGQFVLEKYTPGESVTYKKNPYYWDASAVKLSGIDVKFYSSTQTELLGFQSGAEDELNGGNGVAPSQVGSTPHHVDVAGWEKFDGLVFNTTQAPLNNVKVRQAIAWALNRKQIVSAAYQGQAVVANDYATFPDYGVQPKGIAQREANLTKVKQLLAGVATPITFTITTYTGEQTLAQAIQQQLDATGDFKVSINALSEGAYYAGSNSTTPWLNAPVTITDWADRLPAQLETLLYATGAAWNASHYSNPQLDSLTSQYEGTTNTAVRQKLATQIAQIEYNDVPVIIPAFDKLTLILSSKVHGSFTDGQDFNGGFDFRGISVS